MSPETAGDAAVEAPEAPASHDAPATPHRDEAAALAELGNAISNAGAGSSASYGNADAGLPRPHRCDVLIADDSGPSREILSAILRNFLGGLRLHEVRNGDDALRCWQELNPHITMLDLDMPGTDGMTALQKIREADPTAFVAIVSGGSSVDNVRKALSLGAGAFVVKPYNPQRILDVLHRHAKIKGPSLV